MLRAKAVLMAAAVVAAFVWAGASEAKAQVVVQVGPLGNVRRISPVVAVSPYWTSYSYPSPYVVQPYPVYPYPVYRTYGRVRVMPFPY